MPETDTTQRRDKILIAALAVLTALVTLAVYLPALRNGFVSWDDPVYVYENLRIRSLDLGFFRWVFTSSVGANWHPLTVFSHAVDYALWGLNPVGHHLTSIIIHALNTCLVAVLAFRLASRGRTPLKELGPGVLATGLATALLFGLHPLHVESVAWVSERKDVLSALFFLLSLLAYLRYASGGSSRRFNYAASLVLFGLALMSKPMAVTLPVVLLILDYYPLKRGWPLKGTGPLKGALLEKLPFFALSAASAVVTLWAQHKGTALKSLEAVAFTERVAVAVRGYAFYIYKTLLPIRLAPIYPMPREGEFFNLWFFASLALLIAITAFCIYTAVYSAKRRRVFLAAWLYYLVTLLPVIGLVQVGGQAAADRYMYLPSIGPFMLAGLGAGWLVKGYIKKGLPVVALVTIAVSALMAYGTVRQSAIWKDSLALWSHEIRLYPYREPVSYNNRGLAHEGQDDIEKALEDYNTAIRVWPGYARAYASRGGAFVKTGDMKRAIDDYNTAIALSPADASFLCNRGIAYGKSGSLPLAIEDLTRAIEIEPDFIIAYTNRGVAYARMGEYGLAIKDFTGAISMDPGDADTYMYRARAYERLGYTDQAAKDYRTADRLK